MKESLCRFRQAIACLSEPLRLALTAHEDALADKATELRLRVDRPVCIQCVSDRYYLTQSGRLTAFFGDSLLRADKQAVEETLHRACEYSVYSRQHEINSGFVTLRGGHRVGICGAAVLQNGALTNVRDVSSLNLRIARQVRGCADKLLRIIGDDAGGVLICGEPGSGKTTLLRDLAGQLSLRRTVALLDERGELAACVSGVPQNDVGLCDVYSGYPKAEAMRQAIRSMAPEIIVCDELGTAEEAEALQGCLRNGVAVIAAVHARCAEEVSRHPILQTGAFSTLVFLAGRRQIGELRAVQSVGEALAA